ncbi:hypothetical protein CA983_30665 [Streptomyces swartbergensis]|uniref:Uncharacterized protein n=1 Tax=Streptomyces swartbergensis TaxID=487165 RepID=A0A243RQT5_9ACTN|nr:hypothetical protein CA983_30665 [Streptomyces swartbergensis]
MVTTYRGPVYRTGPLPGPLPVLCRSSAVCRISPADRTDGSARGNDDDDQNIPSPPIAPHRPPRGPESSRE